MIITWSYGCLIAALTFVLILGVRPLWRVRPLLYVVLGLAAVLQVVASGLLLTYMFSLASLCVAFFGVHLLVNMARVVANRLPEDYLYHSVIQAGSWLAVMQLAAGFAAVLLFTGQLGNAGWMAALAVVQLIVALGIFVNTLRQLRKTRLMADMPEISDSKLPTVTVAVPVRNEGGQLEACLTAVLASNYPKLEILAFDDDSTDRTPEIIRSFAHAGVRFLRADKPPAGWLEKNRAYAELAANANGEYIVFCGADIRLGVRSLRNLVALAEARQKTMVAILPQNQLVGHVPILQAMRYYWEMAPPRRLFRRPPVLSSCWLVRRDTLRQAGGFAAVKQSMSPEAHLAHYAASHQDGYSFVRSDERLGITSEKPVTEQRSTALFRRYPQLHRRPELVALVGFGQAMLLLGPLALCLAVWLVPHTPAYVAILAGAAFIAHCIAFGAIQKAAFPNVSPFWACLSMPASVATDIAYIHRSMIRYEFGDVIWKNRSITAHVMRRS